MSNGKVTVVMPAFNEEEIIDSSIRSTCETLEKECADYDLIVVNDGSTDSTFKVIMEEAAKHEGRVKILGYDYPNKGKGFALKYGAMFAEGDYVIFVDSDSEIEPSNLARYLNGLRNADIVIASKRHPQSRVEEPFSRVFLSLGFQSLVRLLTGVKVSDTQAGLKGFRVESLRRILPLLSVKKYAFDVEVLVVAQLLNMKVVELPVTIYLDANFKVRNIARMAIDLLGIAYRLRVKHWYQKNLYNKAAQYVPLIKW